ncbi:AbrB/MazE/SpoVT family DNA-binding domain-containing protein [Candidatus Roizmanbacteria bacterium]|nr:AbrB/MazE/SpoVT family DNA-binding domain-containing protein [Candidatus Roizmanbacteria bacterium]
MTQKIIRVGNSVALTIPKSFIEETGYKVGDQVVVEHDIEHKMLLVKPKEASGMKSLTPEFFHWLENTAKKYENVIKELANR